jgi:hypothetical protein
LIASDAAACFHVQCSSFRLDEGIVRTDRLAGKDAAGLPLTVQASPSAVSQVSWALRRRLWPSFDCGHVLPLKSRESMAAVADTGR